MYNATFHPQISASIKLTDDEFAILWDQAEHHYDFKVNCLVRQGGTLYGEKGARKHDPERELVADFRTIDLLSKSLEMSRERPAMDLFFRLHNILKRINELYVLTQKFLDEKDSN